MQIYVGKGGQQLGPFPLEEINRKLADGTFSATDLAWYEGAAGWAALSSIPGVTLPTAAAPTPAAAPASTPAPTPVAPAAIPGPSTTPIPRTPVPASSYKTLTTVSWVLLGLTALVSLIPFVGCGTWMLGWAVAVAAIIMGIIVITRGGTGQGIMIIVGGVLIVPFALLGQFASLAVFGTIAGKEDRKNQTQIMENLRTIDTAKGQWVVTTKANYKDPVTMANLTSYLSGKEVKPVVDEQYDPSPVGQPPTATLPAKKSLGSFKGGDVLTAASLEEALAKNSFSFYSYKNSPAPTATAKSSPAPTTGGKPSASPKSSVAPKPSETVAPRPSSSARPSPSAPWGLDDESTVAPKPRKTPGESPSSRPSPSAKFAPPDAANSPRPRTSATAESSGLKQGKQNPSESPSPSPEDDDD
ncbi:MAG: domain 2 [Verrucomicrobiota bacterium]